MKRIAFSATVIIAALIATPALAHADDDGGAAALGFMLGAMAATPTYNGPAPTYVYQAPPQAVVQGPSVTYYYSPPPRDDYYRSRGYNRRHDDWRHWRRDEYRHRDWHHDDD